MIISLKIVAMIAASMVAWGVLYLVGLFARFGSDTSNETEIPAAIITALPVVVYWLWYFEVIMFVR